MASLNDRLKDRNYANWLRVTYGLKCVKDGLCAITEIMMKQFQENIKTQFSITEECNNEMCNSRSIRIQGTAKFQCPNSICSNILNSIIIEHTNKNMVSLENCEVRLWPMNCWEIAKVYMSHMPHSRAAENTGPSKTDCSGLLQLVSKCRQFKSKLQVKPGTVEEVEL